MTGSLAAQAVRQEWSSMAAAAGSPPTHPSGWMRCGPATNGSGRSSRILAQRIGRESIDGPPDAVLHTLDVLLADIQTLSKLPELYRLRAELEALGLTELLHSMDAQPLGREEAGAVLRYVWLTSIVEHLQLSDRRLGSFDGENHRQVVGEFQVADREHIQTTPNASAASAQNMQSPPKMRCQTRQA